MRLVFATGSLNIMLKGTTAASSHLRLPDIDIEGVWLCGKSSGTFLEGRWSVVGAGVSFFG